MRKRFAVLFLFLVAVVLLGVIWGSSLFRPAEGVSSLTEEQKAEVMRIGVAYVEENYGTDYVVNGEVSWGTYTEHVALGEIAHTYPVASFRVPADYQQSGVLVNVMVDLKLGNVFRAVTHPSKSLPPTASP